MGSQSSMNGPPPLPQPLLHKVGHGISLLEPLSRKGTGPGLIVLTPPGGDSLDIKNSVPSSFYKWAEEGYTVVCLGKEALNASDDALLKAIDALSKCSKCVQTTRIGLVSYDTEAWNLAAARLQNSPNIVAAVAYGEIATSSKLADCSLPTLRHLAGKSKDKLPRSEDLTAYDYPTVSSHLFATPFTSEFNYAAESVSHTRSLTHLKRHMNGPYFDLEGIWDEHTYWEFENRSVEQTMATMVQEPYVNHVPTMTGGIGRTALTDFYTNHFIFSNPADTELETISRTVGIDRVIDEFIYKFTHDSIVDWLVPGIPPTHKRVEVPMTAVVNIRGDRLYHEHIAWDQASVLWQLGLLPEYLPFPKVVKEGVNGVVGASGTNGHIGGLEYRLPVAGLETTDKMRDKNGVKSNGMFDFQTRSTGS